MPSRKKSRKGPVTELAPKALGTKGEAEAVRGGRAGGDKGKYLIYKMNDIIITSVNPSGANGGS